MARPSLSAVLVIALASAACAGDGMTSTTTLPLPVTSATTVEYRSADGLVRVEVESSAPQVTVSAVDPAQRGIPADLTTFGAYHLGPDGYDGGARVTVDTDIVWGSALPVMLGLLESPSGRWEVLRSAAVGSTDGRVTIAFDVPHFSTLVIVGSDLAIDLDPRTVYAAVGEHWEVYWDLIDPSVVRITNGPAMRGYFYDLESGADLIGTVRPILDEVAIEVRARTSGAASRVPGLGGVGSFALEPGPGFDLSDPDPGPLTEVFSGYDTFTCLSPGAGFFGFTIDLTVRRPDLLIGTRFVDRLALLSPPDGVSIVYDVAGKATCEDHPYVPLARLLQAYHGLSGPSVAGLLRGMTLDPESGGIYSISSTIPGKFPASVDLWDHTGFRYEEADALRLNLTFRPAEFECGATRMSPAMNRIAVSTICAQDVLPLDAGDLIVIAARFGGDLPRAGDGDYFTYSVVFESNDDPADDWQAQEPFDWDLYQGADRWYETRWDPLLQTWSLHVSDGSVPFGPSAARSLIFGDTIVWVIPATEMESTTPAYRVTSFVHDGAYAPEASGGDVSGVDPTEDLLPISALEG